MPNGMNDLFGLLFLFAGVGIILFFGAGILGSQDVEADTANMSIEMQHAYNVTGDAADMSLTVGSFYPMIIGAFFIVCLCLYVFKRFL